MSVMESCTSIPHIHVPAAAENEKPSLFLLVDKNAFMPPPFVRSHDPETANGRVEVQIMSPNIVPTPPSDNTPTSPGSAASSPISSVCTSPDLTKAARTDSCSSIEESPVSSPSDSYAGEVKSAAEDSPEIEPKGSCSSLRSSEEEKSMSDQETGEQELEQKVPKNIKLPQRKGGMQLWQFLYALLNDTTKKYNKLIEWTANSFSREFRLLEPEAIAIWWGEHKNKKNMSYDKLSRSLRYYYDKGIIRKISGERYVYQFCIDPEVMYKHIGNSDSRPKLKPMPQSAHQATSEYQSRHGFSSCALMNKDPCFVAQGPLSLGMVHGPLLPPGSIYPPHPSYGGMASFSPGYSDMVTDFHSSHLHNCSSFYPSNGYDQMTPALPSMTASLGYPHMEPPSPMKVQFPLQKTHSYDMLGMTSCVPKFESDCLYSQTLLMPSSIAAHSSILPSHTSLSPPLPPLTSNTFSSPPFTSQESSLPASYSSHGSPHAYSEDPLVFEEFIPYSSSEDYSVGSESAVYSTHSNSHSHATNLVDNSWD